MAGTIEGARKAAAKNRELYGEDFYKRIGSKGGTQTHRSGKLAKVSFASDDRTMLEKLLRKPKRASIAGRKGGTISRRKPKAAMAVTVAEPPTKVGPAPKPRKVPGGYYKPVVSIIPPHNTFYVYIPDKEG
jgi:general stress protein YciG